MTILTDKELLTFMPTHHTKHELRKSLRNAWLVFRHILPAKPKRRWVHRLSLGLIGLVVLFFTSAYGIALWYQHTRNDEPLKFGVSFVPEYASSLGLDPKETMDALLDLDIKHFRLTSYWNVIEKNQGSYDFSQLDWEFKKAEDKNTKITLAIGLRQPRWPECHMPDWAKNKPLEQWQPQLEKYMAAVIDRYKSSPSLESYQLENEFFNPAFGECYDFTRERLVSEYNLVKRHDPNHTLIISRSNNGVGIPVGDPKPDKYAVSVYKRVWDAGFSKRYLEYPWPAWWYAFEAGVQKINDGRDMILHEMQAESWAPNGLSLTDISLEEQNKSLNAERLEERFEYGKNTGLREVYLWGGEYWYYRKVKLNDPSLWNVAKQEYRELR